MTEKLMKYEPLNNETKGIYLTVHRDRYFCNVENFFVDGFPIKCIALKECFEVSSSSFYDGEGYTYTGDKSIGDVVINICNENSFSLKRSLASMEL